MHHKLKQKEAAKICKFSLFLMLKDQKLGQLEQEFQFPRLSEIKTIKTLSHLKYKVWQMCPPLELKNV